MKTIKSILCGLAIIGGLIALSGFIHAQVTTVQAQSVSGSTALPDGQPDSVVQIAAEAQGLAPASPDQIPPDRCGTFWITSDQFPDQFPTPWPFLPAKYDPASTPIFSLDSAGQSFLVDGTTGTNGLSAADLEAEGTMVLDFIAQVQAVLTTRS